VSPAFTTAAAAAAATPLTVCVWNVAGNVSFIRPFSCWIAGRQQLYPRQYSLSLYTELLGRSVSLSLTQWKLGLRAWDLARVTENSSLLLA